MRKQKGWLGKSDTRSDTKAEENPEKAEIRLRQEYARRSGNRTHVKDSETGTIRLKTPTLKELDSVGLSG